MIKASLNNLQRNYLVHKIRAAAQDPDYKGAPKLIFHGK